MAEIIDHAEITEPLNVPDDESAAVVAARSRERQTTKRIAGAAAIVMLGTVFSRLVAVPRESLIAGLFGDAVVTNSYTIAENVLTIFLDLLLSGIASAVLVPVLSEYVGEDQRAQLGALVGKLLTLVIVGAVLLVLLQIPGFRGTGLKIVPSLSWRDPALRRIGTLYLPVFLGLLLNSWALIVDRNLASRTGEHGIAAMRFATQVQQLSVGIVVTAINVATL